MKRRQDPTCNPWLDDDDDEDDKEDDEEKESMTKPDKDDALLARLLKSRTVILSAPIDAALARTVMTQLLLLEADDSKSPIKVFINSPGGSADSGLAIFDMLRFVRPPVKTICAGLAASAAALILLAPPRENRLSLPNARFMLHQPSMSFQGCASDIAITAREIIKVRERANKLIAEATGKPLDKVTEDTNRDCWLDAGEACEYGLVSRVVVRSDEI